MDCAHSHDLQHDLQLLLHTLVSIIDHCKINFCALHITHLKIWSCIFKCPHSWTIESRVSCYLSLTPAILFLQATQSADHNIQPWNPYLLKLLLPVVLPFIHDINTVGQRGNDTSCSSFESNGFSFEIHCAKISWYSRWVRGVASWIPTPNSKLCWAKCKWVRSSPSVTCFRVKSGGQRWVVGCVGFHDSVRMRCRGRGRGRRGVAYCWHAMLSFWRFINRLYTSRDTIRCWLSTSSSCCRPYIRLHVYMFPSRGKHGSLPAMQSVPSARESK